MDGRWRSRPGWPRIELPSCLPHRAVRRAVIGLAALVAYQPAGAFLAQATRADADMADQAGRIARHERVVGYVPHHNRACRDQRPAPHRDAWQEHAAGAEGRAGANQDLSVFPIVRALDRTVGIDGARVSVIGEADIGPDEDTVLHRG